MYKLTYEERKVDRPKLSIQPSHIIRPAWCFRCGIEMTHNNVLKLTIYGWVHYECLTENDEKRYWKV